MQDALSLASNAGRGTAGRPTFVRDGPGVVIETREDVLTSEHDEPQLAEASHMHGPGSAVGKRQAITATAM